MSSAQSQERVLEYTFLSFGGVDTESGKRYDPKWGMQYSLNVFKDEGHGPMAVIALESQQSSLALIHSLENRGYASMLGIKQTLGLSDLLASFREAQRNGILAGRSRKGAFLNAVTSSKQQLTWSGPEQQKPKLTLGSILGGGGGQQQQQTPVV